MILEEEEWDFICQLGYLLMGLPNFEFHHSIVVQSDCLRQESSLGKKQWLESVYLLP